MRIFILAVILLAGCTQNFVDSRDQQSFFKPGRLSELNKNPVRVESLRKIKDANSKIVAKSASYSGGDLASSLGGATSPAEIMVNVLKGQLIGFFSGSIADYIISKYANDDLYQASLVNSYMDYPIGSGYSSQVYVAVPAGSEIKRDRIYVCKKSGNKIMGQPVYMLMALNTAGKDDVNSLVFLEKMKIIDAEIESNPSFFKEQRAKYYN